MTLFTITKPGIQFAQAYRSDFPMNVSIVVSPRERFTSLPDSLRSLFQSIPAGVPVYVVEGGGPDTVREKLSELHKQRSFQHIGLDHLITPQEARNVGFDQVRTEYVVFADNDIHYEPGWLEALVGNAEMNQADLVAPIICIGPPVASTVHHAGGSLVIFAGDDGLIHVTERHGFKDRPIAHLRQSSLPEQNEIVEFHCFLARSEYIRKVGAFDERLITREQIDFGLRAKLLGARVTVERNAVVTYMAKTDHLEIDLPYMAFRWSDKLAIGSLETFKRTWQIDTDSNRVMNQWIRPHRSRAFASVYKREAQEQGAAFFQTTVIPKEAAFNASTFSLMPDRQPRQPRVMPPEKIAGFFAAVKQSRALNAGWKPAFLRSERPLVVAGMATMPSRRHVFYEALGSILPQVDRLYLFMDGFSYPLQIEHEKIVPIRSQDYPSVQGANGKFFGLTLCGVGPYFLSVDDDILYPPDYVQRLIEKSRQYEDRAMLGVHASVLNRQNFTRYVSDRQVFYRKRRLERDTRVDVLGTDSTLFTTKLLTFDVRNWRFKNMVDLTLAMICEDQNIPRVAISREDDWLIPLQPDGIDSIYSQLRLDDSTQTQIARALLQKVGTRNYQEPLAKPATIDQVAEKPLPTRQ